MGKVFWKSFILEVRVGVVFVGNGMLVLVGFYYFLEVLLIFGFVVGIRCGRECWVYDDLVFLGYVVCKIVLVGIF